MAKQGFRPICAFICACRFIGPVLATTLDIAALMAFVLARVARSGDLATTSYANGDAELSVSQTLR